MKMTPRKMLAISCIATFMFLYQNCALQSRRVSHNEQQWPKKVRVHITHVEKSKFVVWDFMSKEKTQVEIKNYNNSFCKRGFVLKNPYRAKWIEALNNYDNESFKDSNPESRSFVYITINDNQKKEVPVNIGNKIVQLMEETERSHHVQISECQSHKKWSFRNLKSENLVKTKEGSKILQTMIIQNYKTQKLKIILKEDPIKISKEENGEAFCNYELITYSPSPQILTLMFFIDELNNEGNLRNNRNLASNKKFNKSLLVQIDAQSIQISQNSKLGQNINDALTWVKESQSPIKSCGYSY